MKQAKRAQFQVEDKAVPLPSFALPRPGITMRPFSSPNEVTVYARGLPEQSYLFEDSCCEALWWHFLLLVTPLTLTTVCRWICADRHVYEI